MDWLLIYCAIWSVYLWHWQFVAVPNIFSPITYTRWHANEQMFMPSSAPLPSLYSLNHSIHIYQPEKNTFFALLLLHKQQQTRYFPLIIITYFSLSDSIAILLKLQTYLIKRVSSKQYIQYYFSVCSLSCRIQWLHSSRCRCWRLL